MIDYLSAEEQRPPQISDEIRLIPMWSVALAAALFAAVQATVHLYLVKHDHNLPPRGFLIFWSVAWGTVLGVYALMVGYVTRDARRRGMNLALWTPLVIFMPGAIGLVLYFLLRQPLISACPQCSANVVPGMNFCRNAVSNWRPPVHSASVRCESRMFIAAIVARTLRQPMPTTCGAD